MAFGLGGIAAAAGIAKGIGSIFSGIGASKQADAIQAAAGAGKKRVKAFTDQFTTEAKEAKQTKEDILSNSEDVFDRIGGFIFGDTGTLDSLRRSQESFAQLAAGDTSAFKQEVEASVRGALAGSFGLPTGAFENLSAKNLFDFRNRGLTNAMSLTTGLGSLGSSLINTEFGIHDQDFQRRLTLRDNEVKQLNALDLQAAGVEGTGSAAIGNVFDTVGFGIGSFGGAVSRQADIDFVRDNFNSSDLLSLSRNQSLARTTPGFTGGFPLSSVKTRADSFFPSFGLSDPAGLLLDPLFGDEFKSSASTVNDFSDLGGFNPVYPLLPPKPVN